MNIYCLSAASLYILEFFAVRRCGYFLFQDKK